ncbi:hypothetical protein IJ182_04315 [bacterium]|nr:hypothetical protein [bacterium]
MFIFKRNLIYISFFSLMFLTVQRAYSYVSNFHDGYIKYGIYHCVKDGRTCDLERYEGHYSMQGDACPLFDAKRSFEENDKNSIEFFNSKYCQYTPTNVKKYRCKNGHSYTTVFTKDGQVISAGNEKNKESEYLQKFYNPNNCTEEVMMGDNPDPYKTTTTNNNEINTTRLLIKEETEPIYNEINFLKEEIESLYKEIRFLKNENNSQKICLQYLFIILVIVFMVALRALFKSNNNPDNKL